MKKREFRGILIFGCISFLIVIIGIIMKIFNQYANGRAGGRHGGKRTVVLYGKDVIVIGVILLVGCLAMYWGIKKEKNK